MKSKEIILRLLLLILTLMIITLESAYGEILSSQNDITIMVYMCGSTLESDFSSATKDILEMRSSGFDDKNIHVIVMAGGTSKWKYGFDESNLTVFEVASSGIQILYSEEQSSMGDSETLARFIEYVQSNYHSTWTGLILWDHGGGPLEGICYDEQYDMDQLTLNELQDALQKALKTEKLTFIGFDACLMGSVEVAKAIREHAEFMIASEETEPANGWNYRFLKNLKNADKKEDIGKIIIDSYFEDSRSNERLTLSCIDLSRMNSFERIGDEFFSSVTSSLDQDRYLTCAENRNRSTDVGYAMRNDPDACFDLIDLGVFIENMSPLSKVSDSLTKEIEKLIIYNRSNTDKMTGLSIYHPYFNKKMYLTKWGDYYKTNNFSRGYSRYIHEFGSILLDDPIIDWSDLSIKSVGNNTFTTSLTEVQQKNIQDVQLWILQKRMDDFDTYVPMYIGKAKIDADGTVHGIWNGDSLYMVDNSGTVLAGPIHYSLSSDGKSIYIPAALSEYEGIARSQIVRYRCELTSDQPNNPLPMSLLIYDDAVGSYTNRIQVDDNKRFVLFVQSGRIIPDYDGVVVGYDSWANDRGFYAQTAPLTDEWHFEFINTPKHNGDLFAMFQIVDQQMNTYCTSLMPVNQENRREIIPIDRTIHVDKMSISIRVIGEELYNERDIQIQVIIENNAEHSFDLKLTDFIINSNRYTDIKGGYLRTLESGEKMIVHDTLDRLEIADIEKLCTIECLLHYKMNDDENFKTEKLEWLFSEEHIGDIAGKTKTISNDIIKNGIRWSINTLEPDNDTVLLHMINTTDEKLVEKLYHPYFNTRNIQDSLIKIPEVSPHTDLFIEVRNSIFSQPGMFSIALRINNQLLSGLKDDSINNSSSEIHSVSFTQDNGFFSNIWSVDERMDFSIYEPIYCTVVNCDDTKANITLLDGDVTVKLRSILEADNGISLLLEIINNSNQDVFFDPISVDVDGLIGHSWEGGAVIPKWLSKTQHYDFVFDELQEKSIQNLILTLGLSNSGTYNIVMQRTTSNECEKKSGTFISLDEFEIEYVEEGDVLSQ